MPTDVSFYNQPPTVALDPFGAMAKAVGVANALNQNKLFQQMYGSNLAVGGAYKKSLNPDGTLNTGALIGNVVNSGATYNLPETVNQAIASRANTAGATSAEAGASVAQLGDYQKRLSVYDAAMYPYLSGPKPSYSKAVAAAALVAKSNPTAAGDLPTILGQIPQDPTQLKSFGDAFHARSLDPAAAAQFLSPSPTAVDQGPQSTIIDTNPRTNPQLIGTAIPKGMSPEAGSAPTPGPVVGNQPTTLTRQQNLDIATGKASLAPNGAVVYNPGVTPGAVPAIQPGPVQSTGRLGVTGGPSHGAPPRAPIVQSSVPTGAPMGQEAIATAQAGEDTRQANALQTLANSAPDRKGILANMGKDLDNFESGPLAGTLKTAKATANQLAAMSGLGVPFDPNKIGAQEGFNKLAAQLATAQQGALGSDARLDAAVHQNPNEALSTTGNRMIIPMLQGNEDAITAKNEAWQAARAAKPSLSYGQFSTEFNKTYTPRAFQLPYMTPGQRTETVGSMSPQEKAQVLNAYRLAKQRGWIQPQAVPPNAQ